MKAGLMTLALMAASCTGFRTIQVDEAAALLAGPFNTGGAPGAAAQGSATLPLPVDPALTGVELFGKAFAFDAGVAPGWAASNALGITIGL